MAGHPEHAYFAYLPEPVFSINDTTNFNLHTLSDQHLPDNGSCSPKATDVVDQLRHRDDTDIEMGEIRGAEEIVGRVNPSHNTDMIAIQPCSYFNGRGDIDFRTARLALSPYGSAQRDEQSGRRDGRSHQSATDRPIPRQPYVQAHPGSGYRLEEDGIPMMATHTIANTGLTALSMQMVIRSTHSASRAVDLVVQPESAVDQTTFDALITRSATIDDDALVVNHPCRFNDVAHFLGKWSHAQYSDGVRLPARYAIVMQLQSIHQQRWISRRETPEVSDFQGIPWHYFGITRVQALKARSQFHSSIRWNQQRQSFPSADQSNERFYRFSSFHAKHRARFGHYQLRNMLTALSRNTICYGAGSTVFTTSLPFPDSHTVAMDLSRLPDTGLPFHITCMASSSHRTWQEYVAEDVLIAGGLDGDFAMLPMSSQQQASPLHGIVSKEYNGLVTHIATQRQRQSGLLQAVFSSNDCYVRTMDVQTCRFLCVHKYSTPVNATALSPDGRLRLLARDSCQPLLTDAEKGDTLLELSEHSGFGFACAWSVNGRYAATASQDGRTNIWDARSWTRPVDTIYSEMSCVRSLAFTDDDVLVMAENEDILSLWNVRDRCKQDIRFFGSIAGVALLDGGNEIAVANADRTVGGLLVFDRDNGLSVGRSRLTSDYQTQSGPVILPPRTATIPDAVEELVV